MRFHIVTLFPQMFDSYLSESILRRAKEKELISFLFYNPWDFVKENKRVDDKAYGGGPGMVIRPEPVIDAIEKAMGAIYTFNPRSKPKIIFFSPSGKKLDTSYAKKVSKKYTDIILICGRYEGIDARVKKIFKAEEVSIGDFVLTGGEIPAMAVIDTVSRQIEGVLGDFDSLEEERVASSDVYTRPQILIHKEKKYKVPKVLVSGDHKKIDEWRAKKHCI